jgi:hypothetical protein
VPLLALALAVAVVGAAFRVTRRLAFGRHATGAAT